MPLNIDANYDEINVNFDADTFEIQHIKAFNSQRNTEEGTIDRITRDTVGNILPGIYNPGPYDPAAPDTPNGLDIDEVIRKVMERRDAQRKNPLGTPVNGAKLIYKFNGHGATGNQIDVTFFDLDGSHPFAFFMIADPIHSAIRRREGKFVGSQPTPQPTAACIVGRLRYKKD